MLERKKKRYRKQRGEIKEGGGGEEREKRELIIKL